MTIYKISDTPIGVKQRVMTRSAIHQILKQLFSKTAERIRASGPNFRAQAARLDAASAQWMTHTSGSNMTLADMDIRHLRDNLGHESLISTKNFLHSEDDKRHQDTEEKHRLSW